MSKFADKWNLKFNATKSKVMVVGRRIDRGKVWTLCDNCIHDTNEYKYLGVYVTRTLKSNYHVQTYIKDNIDNKINFILRIPAEHAILIVLSSETRYGIQFSDLQFHIFVELGLHPLKLTKICQVAHTL